MDLVLVETVSTQVFSGPSALVGTPARPSEAGRWALLRVRRPSFGTPPVRPKAGRRVLLRVPSPSRDSKGLLKHKRFLNFVMSDSKILLFHAPSLTVQTPSEGLRVYRRFVTVGRLS